MNIEEYGKLVVDVDRSEEHHIFQFKKVNGDWISGRYLGAMSDANTNELLSITIDVTTNGDKPTNEKLTLLVEDIVKHEVFTKAFKPDDV